MTKIAIIALIYVAGLSSIANAADLVRAYDRQLHPKRYQYVDQQQNNYARCDELVVEYRQPYVPHTEIVRLCDGYLPQVVKSY